MLNKKFISIIRHLIYLLEHHCLLEQISTLCVITCQCLEGSYFWLFAIGSQSWQWAGSWKWNKSFILIMYIRGTKCTLFLFVGPDFITDLHFLVNEHVHLIWFFSHLNVRQSRCDTYRLVVNNFPLFYALNSLLLKLENKNTPGLCISVTKSIVKTWNFINFFQK